MGLTTTLVAAVWGFGEATLFFIVPDVLLTLVALRQERAGLLACSGAIVGAIAGGLLMYCWGRADPAGAAAALDAVPAIAPGTIQEVRRSLETSGLVALFFGPLTGTPYKIYAVTGGGLGLGLPGFLLVSVPARGLRFVALTLLASWVSRRLLVSWSLGRKRMAAGALWAVFYAVYFAVKWDG